MMNMRKGIAALTALVLMVGGTSAWAERAEVKRYDAGEQVKNLRVEAADRKIVVEPSEDGQIHVEYRESEQEFYEFTVENEETLVVQSKTNKSWNDYFGFKSDETQRTLTLELPDGVLENLEISTTNENITIPEMSVGQSVTIYVNNGDIQVESLEADAIKLETKNGNVTGTLAGGYDDYDITAQARKGDSNLPERKEGGEKTLNVYVNNGDIQLEMEPEK